MPLSDFTSWSCFGWQCWRKWRGCLLVSSVVTYGAITLIVVPLIIALMVLKSPQFTATFIATFFVLLTLPISLTNLLQHVVNYTNPDLQTYLCRMILAAPVFSISSLFAVALVDYGVAPYMEFILQCYEAFALYMFFAFIVKFLYQTYGTETEEMLKKQKPPRHMFSCLFTCPVGKKFVDVCRAGVLQFLFFKPLLAFIQMITEIYGVYGDTLFSFRTAFLYIAVGNFFTIFTALYALLAFYRGNKTLLEPVKPIAKLIAIKSIVFIPFVQNVVLSVLVRANVVPQDTVGSGEDQTQLSNWADYGFTNPSNTLSNLLITFEMLFVAMVYYVAFSHRPYKRSKDRVAAVPIITFLLRLLNLTDLLWDATSTVQGLCEKPGKVGDGQEMEVKYHEAKGLLPYGVPAYQSADESSEVEYERPTRSPPSQVDGIAVVATYNGHVSDSVPLVDREEN